MVSFSSVGIAAIGSFLSPTPVSLSQFDVWKANGPSSDAYSEDSSANKGVAKKLYGIMIKRRRPGNVQKRSKPSEK